jgi:hypothetical protein
MTNLSQLRAELAENKMDVLTPQTAFMVKGGKSKKGSKKKSKKNSKGGNNYGGGYGCGCGCGH